MLKKCYPESLEVLSMKICSYFLLDFAANFGPDNFFIQNPEEAIPKEVQDYFQPFRHQLVVTRKFALFKKIWRLLSRPGKYDAYKVWLMAGNHESNELHLHEVLMVGNWSSKVFFHMKRSTKSYDSLTKLTLDSRESTNNRSFLYETEDYLLKDSLKVVLSKIPNLLDLTLNSFCDDDILSEVLTKYCQKLKRLKIGLEVLNTPDARRVTDEGMIDFIEDAKCRLEHLDLIEAQSCSITAESIVCLRKFSSLTSLEIHGKHLSYLDHAISIRENHINSSVTRLKIVQHIFHDSIKNILEDVDKVFKSVQHLEVDFSLPGSNIWREIDNIHLANLPKSVKAYSGQVPRHVEKLFELFPKIEALTMTEVRGLEHTCQPVPQLKSLSAYLTDLSFLETLTELLPNLPRLAKLEMNAFPSFKHPCDEVIKPILPAQCEFHFKESYMDGNDDGLMLSMCNYMY